MKIKFKKLVETAVIPTKGTEGSAGFDLTATSASLVLIPETQETVWEYGTGIAVEIPKGHVGLVFPRSSVFRTGAILSNCVGVIDSDYRGEITAKFYADSEGTKPYSAGQRICQLIIIPIPEVEFVEVDALSATQRGSGGYGSTGV